jgi:hypothetical protein
VQESQWLLKLHTYGLLRNSFRPREEIRSVRTIWRLRGRHVQEAGSKIQHMQKALTTMNVQLANAISDVSGVTGQAIIRATLTLDSHSERLARALEALRARPAMEQERRRQAVRNLLAFGEKHHLTLGEGVRIKDLLHEGHKH